MGFVFDFMKWVANAIPVLIAKVATFLLIVFTFGLFAGYALAFLGYSPYYLLIPVIGMVVMWYKLDEGFVLLLLLLTLAFIYPSIIGLS